MRFNRSSCSTATSRREEPRPSPDGSFENRAAAPLGSRARTGSCWLEIRVPERELEQGAEFLRNQTDLLKKQAKSGKALARPTPAPDRAEPAEAAAWVDFSLAMLNRNEFFYIP